MLAGWIEIRQEGVQSCRVEFGDDRRISEDCFDFRGEDQNFVVPLIVNRLDAYPIPGDEERLGFFVPDRKTEHPAQFREHLLARFLVKMHQDFCIGCGSKMMSLRYK